MTDGPGRVLVVDDEPALGTMVQRALEPQGYAVSVTSHARAFKQLFESFAPTVVIIDIVMPDTDGIELIRWIAARNKEIRVIIASGSKSEYAKAAALLGAAAGLKTIINLRKPLSLKELREAVRG
ncbi:MAG: response regulator [Alphaproteobacteria bacterium]